MLTDKLKSTLNTQAGEDLLETLKEELHRRNLGCNGDKQELFENLFSALQRTGESSDRDFDLNSTAYSPATRKPASPHLFHSEPQSEPSMCMIS